MPAYTALLQRCRQAQTVRDFPQADIEQLFSTSDTEDRDIPIRELTDFVLSTFGEGVTFLGKERVEAIPGAIRFIEEALRNLAPFLTKVDIAMLLALRGQLFQCLAYDDPYQPNLDSLREAIKAYQDAVVQLLSEGSYPTLRRHLAWRGANLSVEAGDGDSAADLLQIALSGPLQSATGGLYFQCATRLLRLDPHLIHRVLYIVQDDLKKVWARIPAKRFIRGSQGSDRQNKFLGLLAIEPMVWHHDAYTDSKSEWIPADRLGICVLLLQVCKEIPKAEIYREEATILISCFRRIHDNPHLELLRRTLNASSSP